MDYNDVLKLAGFEVNAFEYFGGCQGQWIAIINGGKDFIIDYYGTCSGCDDLEAFIADSDYNYSRKMTKKDAVEFCKDYDIRPIHELLTCAEIDVWDEEEMDKLKKFKEKWGQQNEKEIR